MSGAGHRSILLTSPEGEHSPLLHTHSEREPSPGTPASSSVSAPASGAATDPESAPAATSESAGVQFDADQLERGRSRTKFSRQANSRHTSGTSGTSGARRSVSRSRSKSSASRKIKDEEFLKWTVLRRDPSMRLKLVRKDSKSEPESNPSNASNGSDESDDLLDDDDDDDDDEDDDDWSDEEQVVDVPNDFDIDKEFHYELGMKVLPNFVVSLNEVLESSKSWIKRYDASAPGKNTEGVTTETLPGGYFKSMQVLTKGKGSSDDAKPRSYILCTDLSSESQYALTYVMGSVIRNGDTLYLVNWDNSTYGDPKTRVEANVTRLRASVLHMFDCISAVVDDLDVFVLSLQHPYPKQLLTEMIFGLRPIALCCSLSMILSTLQNYVCSVPTLVIRKKLKRSKKKGISE